MTTETPTPVTAFVPVSDLPEAKADERGAIREKLLIYAPRWKYWRRNKKLKELTVNNKPDRLSNLNDEAYNSFAMDVQNSAPGVDKRMLVSFDMWIFLWVFVCDIFVPISDSRKICTAFVCFLLMLGLYCRYKNRRNYVDVILPLRIYEWQPVFEKHGYTLQLVVARPNWWNHAEAYVRISNETNVGNASEPKKSAEEESSIPEKEEAKYLILLASQFPRRNMAFRMTPLLNRKGVDFPKPPSLQNLQDQLFQALMIDVAVPLKMHRRRRGPYWAGLYVLLFFLLVGVLRVLPLSVPVPATFLLSALALLFFEQIVLLHHLPPHNIPTLIEEWKSRLVPEGFTVSYEVDQPNWWNWKESYMHIRRCDPTDSVDSSKAVV